MPPPRLLGVPFYPELSQLSSSERPGVLEIFSNVQRHRLTGGAGGDLVRASEPRFTPLQPKVLDLLGAPCL